MFFLEYSVVGIIVLCCISSIRALRTLTVFSLYACKCISILMSVKKERSRCEVYSNIHHSCTCLYCRLASAVGTLTMDSFDLPLYVKCGTVLMCRCVGKPFFVGRILTVSTVNASHFSAEIPYYILVHASRMFVM